MSNHRAEDCVSCVLEEDFTDITAIKALLLREVQQKDKLLAERAKLLDVLAPSSRQTLIDAAQELALFWKENHKFRRT